jgi:hypothetical protein
MMVSQIAMWYDLYAAMLIIDLCLKSWVCFVADRQCGVL